MKTSIEQVAQKQQVDHNSTQATIAGIATNFQDIMAELRGIKQNQTALPSMPPGLGGVPGVPAFTGGIQAPVPHSPEQRSMEVDGNGGAVAAT